MDLAAAAAVSRTHVGRIERGERAALTLDAVDSVAVALGASADIAIRWHRENLDRLLDEAHARLVDVVVQRLRALGWDVAVEVSFSRNGERGSIDVLAFNPRSRALIVIEVKSVTPDRQAMLAGIDRKARLGPVIARDRGWNAAVVAGILVIWDTRTNRRRIEAHAASVRTALPAGTREVLSWLAEPTERGIRGVWFVSDVRRPGATGVRRQRVRGSSRLALLHRCATSPRALRADRRHERGDYGPLHGRLSIVEPQWSVTARRAGK